ncbi:MAG: hypothetical protein ACFCU4_04885 [Puniceicoccaceae bacterium]
MDIAPRAFATLLLLLFLGLNPLSGQALSPKDYPVSVNRIQFSRTSSDWIQAEIRLDIRDVPAALQPRNPKFADDVTVRLTLAFEDSTPSRPETPFRFFQAQTDIISMESRKPYTIYFFLPAEIRDRDDLGKDPFAGLVELSIGGREIPIVPKDNLIGNLRAGSVEEFLRMANSQSSETEGQMLGLAEVSPWIFQQTRLDVDRIPPIAPRKR